MLGEGHAILLQCALRLEPCWRYAGPMDAIAGRRRSSHDKGKGQSARDGENGRGPGKLTRAPGQVYSNLNEGVAGCL